MSLAVLGVNVAPAHVPGERGGTKAGERCLLTAAVTLPAPRAALCSEQLAEAVEFASGACRAVCELRVGRGVNPLEKSFHQRHAVVRNAVDPAPKVPDDLQVVNRGGNSMQTEVRNLLRRGLPHSLQALSLRPSRRRDAEVGSVEVTAIAVSHKELDEQPGVCQERLEAGLLDDKVAGRGHAHWGAAYLVDGEAKVVGHALQLILARGFQHASHPNAREISSGSSVSQYGRC